MSSGRAMAAEQSDVCGVAGTEIQSGSGAGKLRQFAIPIPPRRRRCRRAGASRWNRRRTPAANACGDGLLQSRIGGQPEIIVGAEIDVRAGFPDGATAIADSSAASSCSSCRSDGASSLWMLFASRWPCASSGSQAEIAEEPIVFVALGIGSGEQFFADEDGIGSGEEAQRGGFARQRTAAGAEAHAMTRASAGARWRSCARA